MIRPMSKELVSNRRALHDYEVLETFEAGLQLLGTEIKSLRNHGGSLQDAYVEVRGSAAWLRQASIAPYSFGGLYNHEERRERKLLLHKRELERLRKSSQEKGMTLIPLSIYLTMKGLAKVRVAIAKGKKSYDKRLAVKEREEKRSMQRAARGEE